MEGPQGPSSHAKLLAVKIRIPPAMPPEALNSHLRLMRLDPGQRSQAASQAGPPSQLAKRGVQTRPRGTGGPSTHEPVAERRRHVE